MGIIASRGREDSSYFEGCRTQKSPCYSWGNMIDTPTNSDAAESQAPVQPHGPAKTFWWREDHAPQPVGTYHAQFSRSVSLIAALFLISSLSTVLWLAASVPKLDRVEAPERALERMVGRTMDVQEGLTHAPPWIRTLLTWITGNPEQERTQAIEWYRELAKTSNDPIVQLQLAILQAESGQVSQALLSAHEWESREEPLSRYGDFLRAAYGEGPSPEAEALSSMWADAAESLSAGWFYDRLAERLAVRAGDTSALEVVRQQSAVRADRIFQHSWRLTVVELSLMALGSLVLLWLWRRRHAVENPVTLHSPGIPPPWPGGVGAAVLLRGGAMGAMITAAFLLYMPPENASLRALAIPMSNVPLLLLAYRHLFRPSGLSFDEGFGLGIGWNHLGRLCLALSAVVAAGLWGEWVVDRLADRWNLSSHWTEWFDADLVWGAPSATFVSLIEYVVFAPVFEELAFRGLLFAILRRKFTFLPAALISAGIFGIAHGYGILGLLSVCWSGLLWAWIYEKTGSLLPGMLAHAINNLLVCLAVMALLR